MHTNKGWINRRIDWSTKQQSDYFLTLWKPKIGFHLVLEKLRRFRVLKLVFTRFPLVAVAKLSVRLDELNSCFNNNISNNIDLHTSVKKKAISPASIFTYVVYKILRILNCITLFRVHLKKIMTKMISIVHERRLLTNVFVSLVFLMFSLVLCVFSNFPSFRTYKSNIKVLSIKSQRKEKCYSYKIFIKNCFKMTQHVLWSNEIIALIISNLFPSTHMMSCHFVTIFFNH